MASSGMLRHVPLVRTDVSEELRASFIRVTRIGELGTTLVVTSNRRTLRRNTLALISYIIIIITASDLVVRIPEVSDSIPDITRYSEKQRVSNGLHSAS
jgi:hypothetical protein